MSTLFQTVDEPPLPKSVSILSRLIPALSYAIPAPAAALSAILFINVMRAMRMAESAGIAAVSGGMAEATLPTLIALYLTVFVGVIGIVVAVVRMSMSTATSTASAWFFLIAGVIGLTPVVLLWEAESLLVEVVSGASSGGVAEVASSINLCLVLSLITGAVGAMILLVASVIPLPSALRARQNIASLVVLVLMELALIGMTAAFQTRVSWFHQVAIEGHL